MVFIHTIMQQAKLKMNINKTMRIECDKYKERNKHNIYT